MLSSVWVLCQPCCGYAAPCSKASLDPMCSGEIHHHTVRACPQLPSGFCSPAAVSELNTSLWMCVCAWAQSCAGWRHRKAVQGTPAQCWWAQPPRLTLHLSLHCAVFHVDHPSEKWWNILHILPLTTNKEAVENTVFWKSSVCREGKGSHVVCSQDHHQIKVWCMRSFLWTCSSASWVFNFPSIKHTSLVTGMLRCNLLQGLCYYGLHVNVLCCGLCLSLWSVACGWRTTKNSRDISAAKLHHMTKGAWLYIMVCVVAVGQHRAGSTSEPLEMGATALSECTFKTVVWCHYLIHNHLHTCCPRVAGDFLVLFYLCCIKMGTISTFQVNPL